MSNKETIEEAAERVFPTEWTGSMSVPTRGQLNNRCRQEGFIKATKTMYSEEILNILDNVLYWDTCPDDYKVVISNFLNKQNK